MDQNCDLLDKFEWCSENDKYSFTSFLFPTLILWTFRYKIKTKTSQKILIDRVKVDIARIKMRKAKVARGLMYLWIFASHSSIQLYWYVLFEHKRDEYPSGIWHHQVSEAAYEHFNQNNLIKDSRILKSVRAKIL